MRVLAYLYHTFLDHTTNISRKMRAPEARRERQTMFKIVTWTKQTWKKHHNTVQVELLMYNDKIHLKKKHKNHQVDYVLSIGGIPYTR